MILSSWLAFRAIWIVYLLALVLYTVWFRSGQDVWGRRASRTLRIGVAAHTVGLVVLGVVRGEWPPVSLGETFSLLAWSTAAIYVYLEFRSREWGMGLMAAFIITTFSVVAAWAGPSAQVAAVLRDYFFAPHALANIFAFGCFTMSAFLSLAYVLQYRQLRNRNPGLLLQRLPALETLDRMARQAVRIGFFFLSVGLVLGAILAENAWGTPWSWDPKQCMTLLTWMLYGGVLVLRRMRDWQGGRVAVTNLVAFASMISGLVLIRVLVDSAHRFG